MVKKEIALEMEQFEKQMEEKRKTMTAEERRQYKKENEEDLNKMFSSSDEFEPDKEEAQQHEKNDE